jgi:tetratricopeptide (TPR) repeat protein
MQFFEVRAYRDAIREFSLVREITPSAEVWFNIGRAHEELGEYERARLAFERYLRDRVDAPDAAAIRQRLAALAQRAAARESGSLLASGDGSLKIQAPASGAVVALDGRVISQRSEPLLLAAGRHRLEVTREGFVPFRAELSIEPGMLTTAHPVLQPLTRPAQAPVASQRATWWALGVAGAGLLASGVFGALAIDRQAHGDAPQARAWADRSDVALAGTSVCALTAAILFFSSARSEPPAR